MISKKETKGRAKKAPAIMFYVDKWFSSTMVERMSLEQRAVYFQLLMRCWEDDDCSLQNDLDELEFLGGCHLRADKASIMPLVLKSFMPHPWKEGYITNERLFTDWQERTAYGRQMAENAQARWAKNRQMKAEAETFENPEIDAIASENVCNCIQNECNCTQNICSSVAYTNVKEKSIFSSKKSARLQGTEAFLETGSNGNSEIERVYKEFEANKELHQPVTETEGGGGSAEKPPVKKTKKSKFESDTPSNVVCRFLLAYCLFKSTPEQRAALTGEEPQAVRAEAARLMAEPGFDAERLEEWKSWAKRVDSWWVIKYLNLGKTAQYKVVRDNWAGFLTANPKTSAGVLGYKNPVTGRAHV